MRAVQRRGNFCLERNVVFAHRHGLYIYCKPEKPWEKYKTSWRAFVLGHKVDYTTLEHAILSRGLQKTAGGEEIFDTRVYKVAEQLLGCVGCYKAHDDHRELVPLDPARPLADYLVQNLRGDEVLVKFRGARGVPATATALAPSRAERQQEKRPPPSLMRLKELVSSLSTARATDYEQWRDVGFALKSATDEGIPDGDLLNLYDEFSQKADNYDHDAVLNHRLWECGRTCRRDLRRLAALLGAAGH